MQLYDITIAANTTRQLDAPGSYFYYYAGSAGGADSTITLRGLSSGLRLILKPGQAFRLPQGQKETAWVMTNYANTATILGSVLVGDGDITDNRLTGTVEVVDGGKSRTLAGGAFSLASAPGAVAGQYTHCGIWNQAGSGKNVIIEKFVVSSSVVGGINWGTATGYLGTLGVGSASKKSGAAVSAGLQTSGNSASAFPTGFAYLGLIQASANTPYIHELREPIVITPNNGFAIASGALATQLTMTIEFFEESAS